MIKEFLIYLDSLCLRKIWFTWQGRGGLPYSRKGLLGMLKDFPWAAPPSVSASVKASGFLPFMCLWQIFIVCSKS